MKKLFIYGWLLASVSMLFLECKKMEVTPVSVCDVQQFGPAEGGMLNNDTTRHPPYLFSKTYDSRGKTSMIDAYLYQLGGGTHWNLKLLYQSQMVYGVNVSTPTDTLVIITLNAAGKPVNVQQPSPGGTGSPKSGTYQFTYDAQNRLHSIKLPGGLTDTCIYDQNGNVLAFGDNLYVYDYARTAKKQFYFDLENISEGFLIPKLLMYLNYFPELTSPVNVRTKSLAPFIINYYQFNHTFDSDGKLISYDYSTGPVPNTDNPRHAIITWNCSSAAQ